MNRKRNQLGALGFQQVPIGPALVLLLLGCFLGKIHLASLDFHPRKAFCWMLYLSLGTVGVSLSQLVSPCYWDPSISGLSLNSVSVLPEVLWVSAQSHPRTFQLCLNLQAHLFASPDPARTMDDGTCFRLLCFFLLCTCFVFSLTFRPVTFAVVYMPPFNSPLFLFSCYIESARTRKPQHWICNKHKAKVIRAWGTAWQTLVE